jgi:predicted unusual protein kinase regulating ubiquinone biosynthesis (AarF/ABC1/UbiB family)
MYWVCIYMRMYPTVQRNDFYYNCYYDINVEKTVAIDDREITKLVLEVVGVAENNGLKLPREFGLLMKQVNMLHMLMKYIYCLFVLWNLACLLFYQLFLY